MKNGRLRLAIGFIALAIVFLLAGLAVRYCNKPAQPAEEGSTVSTPYVEGSKLMADGQYAEARTKFEEAAKDEKFKVDALDSIAQCYYREGNDKQALATAVRYQALP